jgi:large subunit ribosomal protein L17
VLARVFSEYAARFEHRPGGYTRILKLGRRPGDQAAMNLLELVTEPWPPATTASAGDDTGGDQPAV